MPTEWQVLLRAFPLVLKGLFSIHLGNEKGSWAYPENSKIPNWTFFQKGML